MHTEEVKHLIIKEIWYFDKQNLPFRFAYGGICPIRLYFRDEDVNQEVTLRKTFWVYYPEIRTLLAKNESLTPGMVQEISVSMTSSYSDNSTAISSKRRILTTTVPSWIMLPMNMPRMNRKGSKIDIRLRARSLGVLEKDKG